MFLLKPEKGAVRNKKRKGCGTGSGHGKTSTKGHKGQRARSGGGVRIGFEGGQMPLYRRLAKRGFKNFQFKKNYQCINVEQLNYFEDNANVNKQLLKDKRLIDNEKSLVKILGNGNLEKQLNIEADAFSKSAIKKIEAKGGKVTLLNIVKDDNEQAKKSKKSEEKKEKQVTAKQEKSKETKQVKGKNQKDKKPKKEKEVSKKSEKSVTEEKKSIKPQKGEVEKDVKQKSDKKAEEKDDKQKKDIE